MQTNLSIYSFVNERQDNEVIEGCKKMEIKINKKYEAQLKIALIFS